MGIGWLGRCPGPRMFLWPKSTVKCDEGKYVGSKQGICAAMKPGLGPTDCMTTDRSNV